MGLFSGSHATKRCKSKQKRRGGFKHIRARSSDCAGRVGQARNAMPGRTIGQQMPASARDTSRWLQALQTPQPRRPVHPARRVWHTRHTAPGPQHEHAAPDNPALPPLPAAPVAARGAPAESTSQRGAAPHSSRRRRRRAEPLQLPGWQRAASSGNSIVVRRCTAGTLRGRQRCRRSAPAKTRGRAKLGGKDVRFERWLRLSFELRASHEGLAAHLVEETAERLDYGCVREQSSDSEAAGPCVLGQGCQPRGAVHFQ